MNTGGYGLCVAFGAVWWAMTADIAIGAALSGAMFVVLVVLVRSETGGLAGSVSTVAFTLMWAATIAGAAMIWLAF